MAQEWVKLNVGGIVYHTTRTTLMKDENSMIYKMFSQDDSLMVPGRLDDNGCYLIDRWGSGLSRVSFWADLGFISCLGTADISSPFWTISEQVNSSTNKVWTFKEFSRKRSSSGSRKWSIDYRTSPTVPVTEPMTMRRSLAKKSFAPWSRHRSKANSGSRWDL